MKKAAGYPLKLLKKQKGVKMVYTRINAEFIPIFGLKIPKVYTP